MSGSVQEDAAHKYHLPLQQEGGGGNCQIGGAAEACSLSAAPDFTSNSGSRKAVFCVSDVPPSLTVLDEQIGVTQTSRSNVDIPDQDMLP